MEVIVVVHFRVKPQVLLDRNLRMPTSNYRDAAAAHDAFDAAMNPTNFTPDDVEGNVVFDHLAFCMNFPQESDDDEDEQEDE